MSAAQLLAELAPDARAAALAALDEISRPLARREIEDALIGELSRSQRRAVARALVDQGVIALRVAP